MDKYSDNKKYYDLVAQWSIEKKLEQQANIRRIDIENKLLDIIKPDLRESGTNNFSHNLKVLTGLAATCDKAKVTELYEKYVADELPISGLFPFKHKWEPDLKALNEIRNDSPDIYNKYLKDALTIKPKKPTFEVKKGVK